ncbi:hypothetical protein K435DRAFT_876955 [Dendrothele bispora CBS 962.96]|uniref:Uncharacterized protein n=1 Tax=Dendrothele bispora (strain CBS 962.96) TaxID=1314807 RepID=A0A4S8KQY1_DENBC|nr:hypothetical protein K435DRAFT_876955 [Dendrothele bispora CBS 962.96]
MTATFEAGFPTSRIAGTTVGRDIEETAGCDLSTSTSMLFWVLDDVSFKVLVAYQRWPKEAVQASYFDIDPDVYKFKRMISAIKSFYHKGYQTRSTIQGYKTLPLDQKFPIEGLHAADVDESFACLSFAFPALAFVALALLALVLTLLLYFLFHYFHLS